LRVARYERTVRVYRRQRGQRRSVLRVVTGMRALCHRCQHFSSKNFSANPASCPRERAA
jgi:hypothetical protein